MQSSSHHLIIDEHSGPVLRLSGCEDRYKIVRKPMVYNHDARMWVHGPLILKTPALTENEKILAELAALKKEVASLKRRI
jgi:hypothetical protein